MPVSTGEWKKKHAIYTFLAKSKKKNILLKQIVTYKFANIF